MRDIRMYSERMEVQKKEESTALDWLLEHWLMQMLWIHTFIELLNIWRNLSLQFRMFLKFHSVIFFFFGMRLDESDM